MGGSSGGANPSAMNSTVSCKHSTRTHVMTCRSTRQPQERSMGSRLPHLQRSCMCDGVTRVRMGTRCSMPVVSTTPGIPSFVVICMVGVFT